MEMNDDERLDHEIRSRLRVLDGEYPHELTGPEELWGKLATKQRRHRRLRTLLRMTASILLLALAGWLWLAPQHSPATRATAGLTQDVSGVERDALAYVAKLCQGDHVVCASEDFKVLEADLAAVAASLDEVNRDMARLGGDEQLLRAKERIEDHQAEIIRAMVQML